MDMQIHTSKIKTVSNGNFKNISIKRGTVNIKNI